MAKILLMGRGKISPIESRRFEQEADLESYLEQFPDLIPLDLAGDHPAKLICIGRQVTAGSGALDLLFIDAAGLVTIVEAKLATNSEVRRTVIGQIVEYASIVRQWSAEQIERQANAYLKKMGQFSDLYAALALSSPASDAEPPEYVTPLKDAFRARIEDNFRKGRIRLVIAVDELVEPLRTTVKFLNESSKFDLMVLQLREFDLGRERRIFIPYLVTDPGKPQPPMWDEKSFLDDARQRRSQQEFDVIRGLYDLAGDQRQFGRGTSGGSFTYRVSPDGKRWYSLITVYNYYGVQLPLGQLSSSGVPREIIAEFRDRLNAIPGIHIPEDEVTLGKYPGIQFEPLTREGNFARFKEALSWLREQVAKLPPGSGLAPDA